MAESNYRDDHKTVMDALLLEMPGVKGGKAFGYPAYKINGKIFAFVGGSGIAIKLPADRVREVVGSIPHAKPFEVAEGIIWKEWVSLDHELSDGFRDDVDLLEESAQYVAAQYAADKS
jgi:hypothetical protein